MFYRAKQKKFNDKMLYKEPGTAKPSEWACPSGRVQMERTGVTRHGGDLEAVWDLSGADCWLLVLSGDLHNSADVWEVTQRGLTRRAEIRVSVRFCRGETRRDAVTLWTLARSCRLKLKQTSTCVWTWPGRRTSPVNATVLSGSVSSFDSSSLSGSLFLAFRLCTGP